MKNVADRFPWRVFWWLLVAGVIGAAASLPYVSEQFFANPVVRRSMPPIPLAVFQFLVIAQSAVYLGLVIPIGLLLAKRIGFGFPLVKTWTSGEKAPVGRVLGIGLLSGAGVGVLALAIEFLIFFPRLPLSLQALDSGSVALWKRLLVGLLYGGIVEELYFRLFLLSLFVWLSGFIVRSVDGHPSTAAFWVANLLAALLFAVGHLPGTSTLAPLTALLITRALLLNGLVGLTCGYLYWRRGIEAAMLAHMGFHLIWQLPGVWIARALMFPVSH